ncbi:MAG: 16S rRNA (cytidine(1402)-2'-O)-methyltransferase [Clostridiales bacterium]|nr:16S rRNA (cytidine(1402)-2'-O)-methyltransferase [Eubacteriales bacterium]MDD7121693.1 16S rRNA (cytidine(1402)-2'-O)-methyltransferase [Clostridiales bacterium]MDY5468502.1 16S rRNA (cytidine(1402)-2'-O)-methyltransferase [Eubacteriales bacterium]
MLYVVATPIGNLGDMSPRAVEVLKSVALIAAEDTRMTMKLTQRFGIETPLTSCHRHNEQGKAEGIVRRMLEEGIDVAVVTDAGTPAISDPGTILVRQVAEAGIEVVAVPGPSAMAAAMSVSGIDVTEFTFLGFLPREKKDLQAALRSAAQRTQAGIVHESPYRVLDFMRVLADTLPQAYVSVSCDLSKLHELTLRGPVAEVLARMEANDKTEKGEYCIVIDFRAVPREEPKAESTLCLEARLLDLLLQGADMRDASRRLVEEGEKKNAVYAAALRLKGMLREEELEE